MNPSAPVTRRGIALTGPSRPIDPLVDAARADIADIRIADRVFASHYAQPLPRVVLEPTSLRAARGADAPVLAALPEGEAFELLEVTGGVAWGIAVERRLVGYVDAAAIGAA